MILTLLMSFHFAMAQAAPQEKPLLTFGFGSHQLEKIELKERVVRGKKRILSVHSVDGRIKAKRILPRELGLSSAEKIRKIFSEFKAEIPLLGPVPCAGKMMLVVDGKTSVFCTDTSSLMAQKKISEWIRANQAYVGLRALE